ncbi:lipopolysaccharide assembly protein LapB [Okeania sp. SIO1H5]|uniref:tetratricopeptide repeat protein n=1 Tax=Okeania sp. SIO1H5 TaxID=2607777 RepID=UPI00257F4A4B|nr:tetratricopeptide repeat protein [Okeania sp. SIO1H5]
MDGDIFVNRHIFVHLFFCFFFCPTYPHPGHNEKIETLTHHISTKGDQAAYYIERANFYRISGNYHKALKDLEASDNLNSHSPEIQLTRGRILAELGQYRNAITSFDSFLNASPEDSRGYEARARVLEKLGMAVEAAHDFQKAIETGKRTRPNWYIEQARLYALAKGNYSDSAEAVLLEGIKNAGEIVALQEALVSLYESTSDYEKAIDVSKSILEKPGRKERWHKRRSILFFKMGQFSQAKNELSAAYRAVEKLPQHKRHNIALLNLKAELDSLRSLFDHSPK